LTDVVAPFPVQGSILFQVLGAGAPVQWRLGEYDHFANVYAPEEKAPIQDIGQCSTVMLMRALGLAIKAKEEVNSGKEERHPVGAPLRTVPIDGLYGMKDGIKVGAERIAADDLRVEAFDAHAGNIAFCAPPNKGLGLFRRYEKGVDIIDMQHIAVGP
jgi:hypothetical protein